MSFPVTDISGITMSFYTGTTNFVPFAKETYGTIMPGFTCSSSVPTTENVNNTANYMPPSPYNFYMLSDLTMMHLSTIFRPDTTQIYTFRTRFFINGGNSMVDIYEDSPVLMHFIPVLAYVNGMSCHVTRKSPPPVYDDFSISLSANKYYKIDLFYNTLSSKVTILGQYNAAIVPLFKIEGTGGGNFYTVIE